MVKLKPVNLIPKEALKKSLTKAAKELYKKNKSLFNLGIISATAISAIVIQLMTVGVYKRDLARAKRALQEAKLRLSQGHSQLLKMEKLKTEISKEEAATKQRLELLFSTSSKDRRYSKLLALIAALTPQDLWINRCILNQDEIKIIGSTLDNQLITKFMEELDRCGAFKNSRFTSSEKQMTESHTIYNFQITTEPVWNSSQATDYKKPDTGINKKGNTY